MEKKNIPYIKQYDQTGTLLNPIKGSYDSTEPNRSQRRSNNTKERFKGNNRGINLTISEGQFPKLFRRLSQLIVLKNSEMKVIGYKLIGHYLSDNNKPKWNRK